MHHGDFYHGEKSMTLDRARSVKMELITQERQDHRLEAQGRPVDREVIDLMFASKKVLVEPLMSSRSRTRTRRRCSRCT